MEYVAIAALVIVVYLVVQKIREPKRKKSSNGSGSKPGGDYEK